MFQVSLVDKIEMLIHIITSSPIFICLTIITILLNIALYINKDNKETIKKTFIIFYIILFIGLIVFYGDTIINILDYLVENVLKIVYFPNLAAYITMFIIANIIMIKTLVSTSKNTIKLINSTIYSILTLLFLLTLYIVVKNNINVYQMFDVYTNKELLVLIELSSLLTIIWIITTLLSKLIDVISIRLENKQINKITVPIYKNIEPIKNNVPQNKNSSKHYDGPMIDTPLSVTKPKLSIFARINTYLDSLVDIILGNKKVIINEEDKPKANNTYLEKVLLEEERPHPTKYTTVTMPIIDNSTTTKTVKNEFLLKEDITLEECYKLRETIISLSNKKEHIK